jgi:pimeloyl-ACP methyl ester carboxylesterase
MLPNEEPSMQITRRALRSQAALGSLVAVLGLAVASGGARAEEPRRFRLPDGVALAYVDRGSGEPALVFIHCGTCQMGMWTETLQAFAPTHRVVAMDLAGHGKSTANRREWSMPGLGADVAALVEALKLRRVVIVGNSLGGPTALEAAKRLGPERVLGIVAVDTLQNVEAVWPEESFQTILASYRRDFAATCGPYMLQLLPDTATQMVRDRVARETCKNDPKAFVELLATLRGYDEAAALRAARVPLRAINSTLFPTAVEVNRKHARSFEVSLMEGVGHYPQVERPAEFQEKLRRFVDELAAARR